jgi:predicted transposase YdaD
VRQLFLLIDWMMNLPRPLELNFCHEIEQYEEEKHMPFMSTLERIGREEGRTEGLAEGQTKGLIKGIEVAPELKFGEAGLGLMPEIQAIADEAKLEALLGAIRTAASPEELRRVWAGRR